ncbi:glycosyltransferase family 2 protein [Porphyromonas sp. COT-239 OH1446]|uniref:glycosyltransferase family 2 protein n=1 Tax=Porphyromonas sp. COT-239 OH1446 TaxID=1515613 RepID=UPI00052D3481|nr:glycosyltransferase family 2 protein [Porphyromonas sp. COT-239 OH1446]KGN70209.1 hypothetical protein HQ37_03965 [Porphyromonas sp. COT-239 OH1446]
MKFDVVIPTKDRPEDLQRILESIEQSSVLPEKVIIVDQSSHIESVLNSSKFVINHLHKPNISGLTMAKNLGVKYCDCELIHFFDDDIIVDHNYFETLNRHFVENPQYKGICGRQRNSKSSRFKLLIFSIFHVGPFHDVRKKCNSGFVSQRLVDTPILPGGVTAYKIEIFQEFQFDETLIRYCLGEDMDFSYRVSRKYPLAFATDAKVLHNHSSIGRYDPVESFACKVAGYSYFYQKNTSRDFVSRVSYALVLLGVLVDAIGFALAKGSFASIVGFLRGLRYVSHRYKGVPFLDYGKIDI